MASVDQRGRAALGESRWSAEQGQWLDASLSCIRRERLQDLVTAMTSIPSPTGRERHLSEFLVDELGRAGLEAIYQPIDADQGNATARYRGAGDGPDLLLYAPIDTHISGTEEEDVPWVGPALRRDMRPDPVVEDGFVIGLCAENPKGYAACIVAAAEAIKAAGVPLRGDLLVGLGAGGMPTNKGPGETRYNAGQGNGCSFMLEQGFRGDFAIIAKAGWAIAWEEVGLCWFKIRVHGRLGYTGQRHRLEHKNPIIEATKVIRGLEDWFPKYTLKNTSGLCAPQGSIGAIEGGWRYKPAFIPAACDIYVDLRLNPRAAPMDAHRQMEEALAQICAAHPELEVSCNMILAIPGATTSPESWIVQSGIRAWEAVAGNKHEPRTGTSGATDANILRNRGIPTVRIGMPPPRRPAPYSGSFSMGVVELDGMIELTKCLVRIAVDTCTRTRAEVGL